MELHELCRRLSFGELSNLSIGSEGTGVIVTSAIPRIITYANEALLRLHTRYLLRENVLFIEQVEHLTYYYLMKRYARSQIVDPLPTDAPPHFYIVDTVSEPFDEDVIKVLNVVDQYGRELRLNDPEDPTSVFTPQPNLLQLPNPVQDRSVAVSYQARHPLLDPAGDLCQEIDLPFALEGALTAFIASLVFEYMNGQDNTLKAAGHMKRYDDICKDVTAQDIVSQSQSQTSSKFHDRGFV